MNKVEELVEWVATKMPKHDCDICTWNSWKFPRAPCDGQGICPKTIKIAKQILSHPELALIVERELPSCTLLELKEAYERGWDLVTDDKSVPADIDLEVRQWAGWSEIGKLLDVKYKEAGFLPVIHLAEQLEP